MNKSVYLITPELSCGKSLISLGLLQAITRKTPRVGFFKPIIDGSIEKPYITTLLQHFNIEMQYEETYTFSRKEVVKYKNANKLDEIYSGIIDKYKQLEKQFDFVLVEGLSSLETHSLFEMDFDYTLTTSLNIPVCLLLKDHYETAEELTGNTLLKIDEIIEKKINIVAVFINKCTKDIQKTKNKIAEKLNINIILSVFPTIRELENPTLFEIFTLTNAKTLYNAEGIKEIIPDSALIGAMQLPNFLSRLEENALIILPADRSDLLIGALIANRSPNFPNVAGIILSGNLELSDSIQKLLSNSPQNTIPIANVKTGTFETATKVFSVQGHIYPENTKKIKLSIQTFENETDMEQLNAQIADFHITGISPKMFQYNIIQQAKSYQKKIVLPESSDERILRAASLIAEEKIAHLILLGEESSIMYQVEKLKLYWDKERISIVNPPESPYYENYAETLYQLRKEKGITPVQAKDLILDSSYFGTMMVYKGITDGMVSGSIHTTAHTIKPALQFIKTKPGYNTVSSVFFMLLENRVAIYGDCAIVPNPNTEQLAEIAISSADTAITFGITPKIAMLSYSSGNSSTGEDVDKVRKATAIVKEKRPDLLIEGPIQYDAAVDPKVGKKKMPQSLVAGQANVLIFPDLNTGNNTYKAVQREANSIAIGPLLQGLNKPVNDLSRGATTTDIYNTIIMTAIQSHYS